jgi:hypothetical protein
LIPYYLALHPQTIELFKLGRGTGEETVALPSWIPKNVAHEVAQQSVSLEDAGESPLFPETLGKKIYSSREAFSEMIQYITPEAISGFINRLTQERQTAVVVFSRDEIERVVRDYSDSLSSQEKVGLVLALHPAFSRQEFSAIDYMEAMTDGYYLGELLRILDLPFDEFESRVKQFDNYLTAESQERLEYLVHLMDEEENEE